MNEAKLNTGLNLRKPLESRYNAYRRFLIFNCFYDQKMITKELKKNFARVVNSDGYDSLATGKSKIRIPDNCMPLAEIFEESVCKESGIKYSKPKIVWGRKQIRNCPECARICYHCYLYDLKWIVRCPLHGNLLTLNCPDCGEPWPKVYELKNRRCQCCGTHIKFETLVKTNSFSMIPNLSSLDRIEKEIEKYLQLKVGTTLSAEQGSHIWKSHHSLDIQSSYFPAVAAYNCSSLKIILQEILIGVPNMKVKTFNMKEAENESLLLGKKKSLNIESVQRDVLNKIYSECKKRYSVDFKEIELGKNHQSYRESKIEDFLQTVVANWVKTCGITWYESWRWWCDDCSLYGEYYPYEKPLKPSVMESLIFTTCHIKPSRHQIKNTSSIQLPISMQEWLYKCDLWKTFQSVLYYIDALKYSSIRNKSADNFMKILPEEFKPEKRSTYPCALLMDSDELLSCLVPEYIDEISFSNIKLYSFPVY